MTDDWAFTVNYVKRLDEDQLYGKYQELFDKWSKYGIEISHKITERGDEHEHLHYHGIITMKKAFYRKKLMLSGFSIKLEAIYDKQGWLNYISKLKKIEQRSMFKVTMPEPIRHTEHNIQDIVQDASPDNVQDASTANDTEYITPPARSLFKRTEK